MITLDGVIKEFGGFTGSLAFFGWQGGTIHQVRKEWTKRLHACGHVIRNDGTICNAIIDPRSPMKCIGSQE